MQALQEAHHDRVHTVGRVRQYGDPHPRLGHEPEEAAVPARPPVVPQGRPTEPDRALLPPRPHPAARVEVTGDVPGAGLYLSNCTTRRTGTSVEQPRTAAIVLQAPDGKP